MASVCATFRLQSRLRLPLTCASGSTCHGWVNDNTRLDNIRSSMGKIKERHTHRCEFENKQRPLCANRVNSHFCWLNNRAFKLNSQQIQSSKKQFISASILCYLSRKLCSGSSLEDLPVRWSHQPGVLREGLAGKMLPTPAGRFCVLTLMLQSTPVGCTPAPLLIQTYQVY